METILIQTDNADEAKLVRSFLEQYKIKGHILTDDDKEDIVLGRLMEETAYEEVIVTKQFNKDSEKELDKAMQLQLAVLIEELQQADSLDNVPNVKKTKRI